MPIWDRDDETEWEKYQKSRGRAARREPAPQEEPAPEKEPLLGRLAERVRHLREEPPVPPETCPWCGGEMKKGYLVGRNGVHWTDRKPGVLLGTLNSQMSFSLTDEGALLGCKTAWLCQKCRKITVDVPETGELSEAVRRTMTQADLEALEREHQEE